MTKYCNYRLFPTRNTNCFYPGILPIVLFAVLFSFNSCIEDPTEIGVDLLPLSDFFDIHTIDTLAIRTHNISYGHLNTSQPANSFLGTGYDPYFGNTTAEFVTQLRLSSSQFIDFPYTIDSMALYLLVENLTGSGEGPHYLSFYEIDKEINIDSTYYSDTEMNYTGMAVTRLLMPTMVENGSTSVRLSIPNSFGEYVVRDPKFLRNDTAKKFPDIVFRKFLKGLHYKLESPNEKAFLSFSLDPPSVALDYSNYFVMYLTDTVDGESEELKLILDATNENARYNIFKTDLTTAENPIEHLNEGYPDTMAYIHRWGSVTTKIDLSDLKKIKDNPEMDGISVTKARLIFPAYFDDDNYTVDDSPSQLLLKFYNTDGEAEYVQDYKSVSTDFYSGGLNDDEDSYVFNIPTFVQAYLDDKADTIVPELEITMLQNSTNSAILKSNDSEIPPTFEFSFVE